MDYTGHNRSQHGHRGAVDERVQHARSVGVDFFRLHKRASLDFPSLPFKPTSVIDQEVVKLQRELGFAFSNLPSLRSLTIRSSSAVLSQPFFVALHAHNPHLEHLALRGPHAGTPGVRGAADTCALVAEWVEALLFEAGQGGEAASALRRLELEVPTPTPAFARPASARLALKERPPTRLEVCRLALQFRSRAGG